MGVVTIEYTENGPYGNHFEGYTLPLLDQRANTEEEMRAAGYFLFHEMFPDDEVRCPSSADFDPFRLWVYHDVDCSPCQTQEDQLRLDGVAQERRAREIEMRAFEPQSLQAANHLLLWFARFADEIADGPTFRISAGLEDKLHSLRGYLEVSQLPWK